MKGNVRAFLKQGNPAAAKAMRCNSCRKWVKPGILALCQAHWLCYHCGAPAPFTIERKP
jgi:hypothetical protein